MTRRLPDPLRTLLRELAEADAAELVAQARERARERAAKLIEDELVDELLRAAGRAGPRESRPAPDQPSSPRAAPHHPSSSEQIWWTYCVLSADDVERVPALLEGVEPGTEVEAVREGALAALVSAVPAAEYDDLRLREHLEDLGWVERTARRHEAVLEQSLGRLTIVPLRLCTLFRDHAGVRRLLREQARPLLDSLAKVDGCAEWGVKVFAQEGERVEQEVGAEAEAAGERPGATERSGVRERPGAPERPGATYLIQRQGERERAERAAQIRAECAEAVHQRVSACAREAVTNPPQRPELHGRKMTMVLNGAYLVADERVGELQDTIGALQAEWAPRGCSIELTGPWPAYNFVTGAMP